MKTQGNFRGRLARILLAAAVPVIAATSVASTAAAAEPHRDMAPATSQFQAADYYWCYFGFWYPCFDHDRYHDWDWYHHRHHDWDHDRNPGFRGHEHDRDWH